MKAEAENLEKAAVAQQCRLLRLPAVAEQCASLAEVAIRQRQTYLRYLDALLAAELEERERNTVARRLKDARLPRMKTWKSSTSAKHRRFRLRRCRSWRRAATSTAPSR